MLTTEGLEEIPPPFKAFFYILLNVFVVLLFNQRLAGATLLVFANKQDLPGALSVEEIRDVSHFLVTIIIVGIQCVQKFMCQYSFTCSASLHCFCWHRG